MKEKRQTNVVVTVAATMVIAVILFLGFGYWYNRTHYTEAFNNNFMSNCLAAGGETGSCGCMLNDLKSKYTYSQAKEFEESVNEGNTPIELIQLANGCA